MTNVEQIADETDCVSAYISKGIAMACFYYARCLHLGRSTKKDEAEAKLYYSKVSKAHNEMGTCNCFSYFLLEVLISK